MEMKRSRRDGVSIHFNDYVNFANRNTDMTLYYYYCPCSQNTMFGDRSEKNICFSFSDIPTIKQKQCEKRAPSNRIVTGILGAPRR